MTDPAGEPSKNRHVSKKHVSKKLVIGEAVWLALFGATWAAAEVLAPADRNSAIVGGVAFAVSGLLLCGWLWRAQASGSSVVGTWAIVLAVIILAGGVAMASAGATLALSTPSPTKKTPPATPPPTTPAVTPTTPPTTPPTTTPPATVRFDVPATGDRQIPAGSELELSGTVEGLAPGHKLFIISKTPGSIFFYVVTGTGARDKDSTSYAAADRDGPWSAHDGGVGSKADKTETPFDFTPYDADARCGEELERIVRNTLGKAHRIEGKLSSGCVPISESKITVTLKR